MVHVRPIDEGDHARWRELFTAYGVFYETEFPASVLEGVWAWIRDPEHPLLCFVAVDDAGTIVGFAHVREQPDTFTAGPGWYLDDLFTDPDARGQGIATSTRPATAAGPCAGSRPPTTNAHNACTTGWRPAPPGSPTRRRSETCNWVHDGPWAILPRRS